MSTEPNLNTANFIAWAKGEGREIACELAAKMAFAKTERERVDAYVAPIFARYKFPVKADWAQRKGELVTKPGNLYLCDDDALCAKYFAEVDAAHAANGYKASQSGECPALVAENAVTDCENRLIKSIGKALNFDFLGRGMLTKDREHLIKLAMGAGLRDVRLDRKTARLVHCVA